MPLNPPGVPLLNRYNIIDMTLKGVVMRDNNKLIEVFYLADMFRKILPALSVHIGCRLIKERYADIRKLL